MYTREEFERQMLWNLAMPPSGPGFRGPEGALLDNMANGLRELAKERLAELDKQQAQPASRSPRS